MAGKGKGKGKTSHTFVDVAGQLVEFGKINKLFKDVLRQHHGTITDGPLAPRPVTPVNLDDPIGQVPLEPSEQSPICQKCEMWTAGCNNPFMPYFGSKNPLVTIVFDSVSPKEDKHGYITAGGAAHILKTIIDAAAPDTGVKSDDCRFIALTRCAHRGRTPPNYKGKGNLCKIFAVQDLMEHPPKVIMPVGTTALGLFCHKSNAQEWGGRELTWRGWPDDWLTDPDYVYDRVIDVNGEKQAIVGHPLFGPPPGLEKRCILFPIQAPRLIAAAQNSVIEDAWGRQIVAGLRLATQGRVAKTYNLPHYRLLDGVNEVIAELQWLIDHPGTLVCYDTETEGLYPFQGQKIVFMMFRFVRDDEPVAIGFPWDYAKDLRGPASPFLEHLQTLRPYVADALGASVLVGHNLVFDILFSHCNLMDIVAAYPLDDKGRIRNEWREAMRRLDALAEACGYDTWHMAYTRRQQRGSLGLDVIAYDYVPELAGYEEEMTLLIELDRERLHPDKGGHYARCPRDLWDSHLKPYVMGDVEVCYQAREALKAKLDSARCFRIPIAHEIKRGFFRYVDVPDRAWLYENIMAPANRVLTKMMGRGMFIDQTALRNLERNMPAAIRDAIEKMRNTKERGVVWQYCEEMTVRDPLRLDPNQAKHWQLDLESKDQLRDILFKRMKLKIQRLTKTGRKLYGEEAEHWESRIEAVLMSANPALVGTAMGAAVRAEMLKYAALDKFTLNKLSVDYPEVRPLQDYRKIHKLYTTYVRPLRNITIEGLDKKVREQVPHLCPDGMIHAQFLLTGTRGGRLSSRSPNLQQLPKEGYAVDGHASALNVKEMYVSRFGKRGCLYGSDFSQIELRLLAALSGDRTMVEAYFNDIDLHTLTTSRIFKLDYEVYSKSHMKHLEETGRDKEAKELKLKRDIGKCVDPATLISVNGNVMRIGQLSPGRKADTFYPITGCRVQTPTGTAVINNFYSNGSARRVLMVSRKGVIACGLNHRFALKDGSLARAEDLKKGDILADAVGLESCRRANEVLFDPFSLGVTCENSPFRVVVTGALAYAIGLFSGDGTVNSNYIAITTGGGEPYRLWQDIVAVALKSAGFEPSVTRSEKRSDGSQSGKVTFGSCRVIDVFEQLGLVTPDKKRALRVPSFILNGSEETKMQFLAGLFDTDGSCERQGMLSVTTKSWELLQDVSAIIRGIGMAFSLEPRWNEAYQKWYFRLNLSVRHSWKFFRRYLRHPEKRAGLHKPAFEYTKEWPNQVLQVIPLDDGPVVDIEIDSCDRLYISNCLSTHNTVNFLTGYGGGAFGLQTILAGRQIYKEIEFCEEIIASFFSTYPAVRELLGYYKRFIQANEVAVSMFGRVRVFDEVSSRDPEIASKALRAGCNHLIQSTASDMMLICLAVIEDMMREAGLDSILMLTVHDSLVIDVVRDELLRVHEIVDVVLNNMPEVFKMVLGEDYDTSWMIVPFAGDSEIGLDYASMKGIPRDCSKLDWDKVLSDRS